MHNLECCFVSDTTLQTMVLKKNCHFCYLELLVILTSEVNNDLIEHNLYYINYLNMTYGC